MNAHHRLARFIHEPLLRRKRNVIGTALGFKQRGGTYTVQSCVIVLVSEKLPRDALAESDLIPPTLFGALTDVVAVGDVVLHYDLRGRPRASAEVIGFNPRDRHRPLTPGLSIGGYGWAGTLGCFVSYANDMTTAYRFILTNAHVANRFGQTMFQPGGADERIGPNNKIGATVKASYPVDNGGKADCAIIATREEIDPPIPHIGRVTGTVAPSLFAPCRKFGRATLLTEASVIALHVNSRIRYGSGYQDVRNQIMLGPMSQPGDSGSLVVTGNQAVGLLFAGSDKATLANPISAVLKILGAKLL